MNRYVNSLLRISGIERFRSAGVLLSGTLLGQLVAFCALPVLTRVYSPLEFAGFAVFAAVLGILAPISCLRYEIAIPLPQDDKEAFGLVVAAVLSAIGLFVFTFIGFILFGQNIANVLGDAALEQLLILVPLGVLLSGFFGAFQYWATRKKAFVVIAKSRVSQAVGGVVVQLGLGILHFGVFGLAIGYLVSCSAGIFALLKQAVMPDFKLIGAVNVSSVRDAASKFSSFPRFSVLESLANNAGIQLPLIILSAFVVGAEVGYLMLVTRVLQAPLSLVGGSLAQVYLSNAPSEYRSGSISTYSIGVIESVMKVAVGPLIFMAFVSSELFGFVFGQDWKMAGVYASWMVPWAIMQMLVFPIGMVFHVMGKQSNALRLQVGGLFFRVFGLFLVVLFDKSYAVHAYAATAFLFYFVYFYVAIKTACINWAMFFGAIKASSWIVFSWLILGVLTRSILMAFV